jgi:hypothetical protein
VTIRSEVVRREWSHPTHHREKEKKDGEEGNP